MTREEREYEKALKAYLLECEKKFREAHGKDTDGYGDALSMERYKQYADEYINGEPWRSPETKHKNQVGVNKFIRFMDAEGLEVIDTQSLLAYRRSLVDLSPNTVAQYMKRLNASLNWMVNMRLIKENPIPRSMLTQERYETAKAVLTKEELSLVLSTDRIAHMTKASFSRSRAIVILLLTSGLRESEALDLVPEDLHWEEGSITVRSGKGHKTRKVPFLPVAQNAVREYMQMSRPEGAGDLDPLFLTGSKDGTFRLMSTTSFYEAVCHYLERTTGRTDLSPHSLRHSFATFLVSDNVNVKTLQAALGHSSLSTTQRYAQLLSPDTSSVEAAKSTFDKLMPINAALTAQKRNLRAAHISMGHERRKKAQQEAVKRERRGRPVKARIPAYPK